LTAYEKVDETISADVVIIGGGILGLMLLETIEAQGYSVLLLDTKDVLQCQTGHSHAFIHWGHQLARRDFLENAERGASRWVRWLEDARLVFDRMEAVFAWGPGNQERADRLAALLEVHLPNVWDATYRVEPPTELRDGWIGLVHAGGLCAPTFAIASQILERHVTRTCRIDALERISQDGSGIEVTIGVDGTRHTIRARRVVLAGGEGNLGIAEQLNPLSGKPAAQCIETFMLTIRDSGPGNWRLPNFTGYLYPIGFIANRQQDDRRYWLVSDRLEGNAGNPQPQREWFKRMTDALFEVFPRLEEQRSNLTWSVFRAAKIEGATPAKRFPTSSSTQLLLENVWVAYPNLFTFALTHAEELAATVTNGMTKANSGWGKMGSPLQTRPEQWAREQYYHWDEIFNVL